MGSRACAASPEASTSRVGERQHLQVFLARQKGSWLGATGTLMMQRSRHRPGLRRAGSLSVIFGTLLAAAALGLTPTRVATSVPARRSAAKFVIPPTSGSVARARVRDAEMKGDAASLDAIDTVGALFSTSSGGELNGHFCSGSVVDSPRHDLVVTAAHCVTGKPESDMVFVPGYRDGEAPFGVWAVERVIVDQAWSSAADPDDDFAFLVVRQPGSTTQVQDLTGGERLVINEPVGVPVAVIGYPDAEDEAIRCENRAIAFSPTQLQFDCAGYTNGTSGSPLIADFNPRTGLGEVIGVIGGHEQGGDTPAVSYAARFGPGMAALYAAAAAQS
jgi:V8-like Glu-specific endopeptidase